MSFAQTKLCKVNWAINSPMHSGVASGVVHHVKTKIPSKRKKSCAQAQAALFKPCKGCGIMYISAVLLSCRINRTMIWTAISHPICAGCLSLAPIQCVCAPPPCWIRTWTRKGLKLETTRIYLLSSELTACSLATRAPHAVLSQPS